MNKINKLSKVLRIIFQVIFWFLAVCLIINTLGIVFALINIPALMTTSTILTQLIFPISAAASLFALTYLKNIFKNYELGLYFEEKNITLYKKFGLSYFLSVTISLAGAIIGVYYMPEMTYSAESFKLFWKGYKIGLIYSSAFQYLYMCLFAMIATVVCWIMTEATKLHKENSYTV